MADIILLIVVSYVVSHLLYDIPLDIYLVQLIPTVLVVALSLYLFSAFEITLEASLSSLLSRNLLAVVVAMAVMLVLIYLLGPGSGKNVYGRGVLSLTLIIFAFYLLVTRYLRFRYLRRQTPVNNWIYVGNNDYFEIIKREVQGLNRHEVSKGTERDLIKVLENSSSQSIVLDDSFFLAPKFSRKLINEKFAQGRVKSLDAFYENYLEKVPIFHVQDYWFLSNGGFEAVNSSIRQRVKRTMDILLVLASLPFTLALGVGSAVAVLLVDKTNPIYRQERVGLHGRRFTIYKIKTMSDGDKKQNTNWTQSNDRRVTRLGKLLRKYRLDELPQLFNVLIGDMSIIGPRPEQPDYTRMLEKEIPYFDIRHSLKPGITGWAQVKFRYGASVADSQAKLEYDLYYIKNYSIILDLTILIKTVYTIFSGSGR